MIEQTAIVVALAGEAAWVETGRQSACGACAMNKGCGAGLFARAFGFASPRLQVMRTQGAAVGDEVVIGIDERALVRGALAAYMVPILFMLGFAIGGEVMAVKVFALESEPLTALSGLAGLAAGLLWLRRHTWRIGYDARYQPVILRRVGACSPCLKAAGR